MVKTQEMDTKMTKNGKWTGNRALSSRVISKNHLRNENRALSPIIYYNTDKYIIILFNYITILSNIL